MLVEDIDHFETIVTKTNKESLLLEINLIRRYQPKYNIKLKQGTMYPYLKSANEKDPQLLITSTVEDKGDIPFGPYPHVYAATETQVFIQKVYPLRKMRERTRNAPACIITWASASAAATMRVLKEEYDAQIKRISSFLNGEVREIKKDLKAKMHRAADNLNFEQAADYRDQIRYIEATVEKQTIMSRDYTNRDVFAFHMDKGWLSIQVFLLPPVDHHQTGSRPFPLLRYARRGIGILHHAVLSGSQPYPAPGSVGAGGCGYGSIG